jgi:(p)ppGpp synthase/HD superfamily hydrolase
MDSATHSSRQRLQVVADADPSALARVAERFQNLNIVPLRVIAELSSNDLLHIEVDVCGLTEEQLALIVAKIRQAPCIVNAHWHRLD